jgi:8-oxo-dGTP pyrophosphatase MutT (NUDIX family)
MTQDYARTNVAGIILNPESEILLAQRSLEKKFKPGIWHLPGGKVEENEDMCEALIRELEEEFQLPRNIIASVELTHEQFEYSVGDDKHRTVLCIVRLTESFTPVLNYESAQALFMKPSDVLAHIGENDELFPQHVAAFSKLNIA